MLYEASLSPYDSLTLFDPNFLRDVAISAQYVTILPVGFKA